MRHEAKRQVGRDAEEDDDAKQTCAVLAHSLGGAQVLPREGLVHLVCTSEVMWMSEFLM